VRHESVALLCSSLLIGAASSCSRPAVDHTVQAGRLRRSCSSIDVVNDGYSVFGKNFDNDYTTEGLILINPRGLEKTSPYTGIGGARARWVSKYASVGFCLDHVGHAWTGMNEKGLVVSMMHIPETEAPPADRRPPLMDGQWIQYMLDTCETVQDVLRAMDNFRIITIDHYHIADAGGDSAVVEFLGGEKFVYTGEQLPISAITNSTYADSINDWVAYNQSPFPAPDGSLWRFRIAADRLEGFEATDPESAVDYAFETLYRVRSELAYNLPLRTEWSMVFDTRRLRVYFRTYMHPQIRYFDLGDFDPSCRREVQVLDIRRDLSGDVSPYFEDLTFDVACDHYRGFVEKWFGYVPSENDVRGVVSFYMGFQCVDPGRSPLQPRRRLHVGAGP
jgi:penicillin V acylase-like amidase (Ntn superfamily)